MKRLIIGDGEAIQNEIKKQGYDAPYIDLRGGHQEVENLMDLYETMKPELITKVRETIIAESPDEIIVVGKLDGYLWLGTIITRFFGQFNSWNNQRENDYGVTTIIIDQKPVKLYAVSQLEDYKSIEKV